MDLRLPAAEHGPSLNCWQSSPLTLAVKILIVAAPSHSALVRQPVPGSHPPLCCLPPCLADSHAKRAAMAKVWTVVLRYRDHPVNLVVSSTRAGRVLRGKLAPLSCAQARALLIARSRKVLHAWPYLASIVIAHHREEPLCSTRLWAFCS